MNNFNEEIYWLTPYLQGREFDLDDNGNVNSACALGAGHLALRGDTDFVNGPIQKGLNTRIRRAVAKINDGYAHINGVILTSEEIKLKRETQQPMRVVPGNPIKARQVLYKLLIHFGIIQETKELVKV